MAEYVLREGETHEQVARALLDQTDNPNGVQWSPRPDVYGGGVYVVDDEETVNRAVQALSAQRDAQAKRISDAQAAADERDARADETGLTPAQLGFPANAGIDPGAPGTEDGTATLAEADATNPDVNPDASTADEEPVQDDPNTPEDESKMTPAQRRKARREAKAAEESAPAEGTQADADASTEEGK